MPVFKRKYGSGKTVWRYMFSAPGSTLPTKVQYEEAMESRLIGIMMTVPMGRRP